MRKFDLATLRANPGLQLVAEYYRKDELMPITEHEIVMDSHLVVRDPFSKCVVIVDSAAETRDEDGNWSATLYMTEGIFTPSSLSDKLIALKAGEEIHFVTHKRRDGYSISRFSLFGADLFIARYWDGDVSVYDATGETPKSFDMEQWLCELTGLGPEEALYLADEQSRVNANHEYFNEAYGLQHLRCDKEGWLISDTGSRYRVERNDDLQDICPDDAEALKRAKAHGIRFTEEDPYCPADLIYQPTKRQ